MLIVVHFPKAGGNSLLNSLQIAYGSGLVRDYSEDPAVPESPRSIDPIGYFSRQIDLQESTQCIMGHFHPNKYRFVIKAVRFTMLRHPVDTLISIYWFFKALPAGGGSLMRYVIDNNISVIQLAQMPLITRLMSYTYFGGVDMSSFDLIGRHESRENSLSRLSRLAGVKVNDKIHANATPESERRREMEADPVVRGKLSEILMDDIRFYEQHAFRDV